MTWISNLALTYDAAQRLPISDLSKKPIPIHHDQQTSHINLIINESGTFLSAIVDKASIVLPATEDSAGRTSSKIAPHGLADNLQYVAAYCEDFVLDIEDKKKKERLRKKMKGSFESYVEQLEHWCSSTYRHEIVAAVLRYVKRHTLVQDLLENNVLVMDAENCLNVKTNKTILQVYPLLKLLPNKDGRRDQSKALVRWSVEKLGVLETRTWLDSTIQKSWQEFVNSQKSSLDVCYGSGELEAVRFNHPKKIRFPGDTAKLISANDWRGFTFRGRFTESNKPQKALQAVNVGNITSQKAHSALRWLINRNHGTYELDKQVIVSWAASGEKIPTPQTDSKKLVLDDFTDQTAMRNEHIEENIDHSIDLGKAYSEKLRHHLSGYRSKLSAEETISILVLDSATRGRMAISYYREFVSEDYFISIRKWYEEFAWYQLTDQDENSKLKKTKISWLVRTPTPQEIVRVLCGTSLKAQPKLQKNYLQRMIPVVIDCSQIPVDFVQLAIEYARNPITFENDYQWKEALGVACSLIRGFFFRHPQASKRKEIPMSLDSTNTSRDYLYGRLLAVADRLEGMHLYLTNSKRSTAAHRLMVRFSDRPYSTWPIIYKHLNPYMQHLERSREGFLKAMNNELDEIMSLFDHDEFTSDEQLSGEFLLGYHLQRIALRSRVKKIDEQIES